MSAPTARAPPFLPPLSYPRSARFRGGRRRWAGGDIGEGVRRSERRMVVRESGGEEAGGLRRWPGTRLRPCASPDLKEGTTGVGQAGSAVMASVSRSGGLRHYASPDLKEACGHVGRVATMRGTRVRPPRKAAAGRSLSGRAVVLGRRAGGDHGSSSSRAGSHARWPSVNPDGHLLIWAANTGPPPRPRPDVDPPCPWEHAFSGYNHGRMATNLVLIFTIMVIL